MRANSLTSLKDTKEKEEAINKNIREASYYTKGNR